MKINPTTVEVALGDERMTLDFYGDNIFRMFQDNTGGVIRDPEARPEARILVENPRRKVSALDVEDKADAVVVSTPRIEVTVDKATRLMRVTDRESGRTVVEQVSPVEFGDGRVTVVLGEEPQEYFYGGGVQNGRFSHKGKIIAIENQNSWTDGGVASPAPFYWSTKGYGVMWYTFRKGAYDFGATETGRVSLSHDTDYLDLFIMVDSTPVALLNDYYQLTGNPVLLPKFGFYQGHLNAYNRDYWTEDEKGILFEDGKCYKESQRDNGGVKESLNGVKAYVDGRRVKLQEAASVEEFAAADNAWYYEPAPDMNRFATAGSEFADVKVVKNPVLHVRLAAADVTSSEQRVVVDGFVFAPEDRMLTRHGALQTPALTTPDDNVEAYAVTPVWTAVDNADYYEIEFDSMLYSTVRSTELLFADLEAETDYTFRVRAVNADGVSDWGEQTLRTKANPLEFAITGITGTSSAAAQGGAGINRLFDFVEAGDVWHTLYNTKAVPFELTIDLHTVNTLDRFDYLPRMDSGNGTILEGSVAYSMDRNTWTEAGGFSWKRDAETKSFTFDGHPAARYVRIRVTKAVGDYGSGREIYVFRVPGSESYIQGDVNNDGKVDGNDLTSYMNYTGLRLGDSDFEGYISRGDIDGNNMIDAYDISVAATQLDGGVQPSDEEHVAGEVTLSANGRSFKAGDEVEIRVSGRGMKAVNALSFALPYDQQSYDFVGIETVAVKGMENLTNDRLHTDGEKVLYSTFVNVGDKPAVEGDVELFVIRLKAKGDVQFDLKARNGVLVDKSLNRVTF